MHKGNVTCITNPSLALVKYWGKRKRGYNLPASTSISLSLGGLETRTIVTLEEEDRIVINGEIQNITAYAHFFNNLRKRLRVNYFFSAVSQNNFPTSAGLASSSSGFAALALACTRLAGYNLGASELSKLARYGSASAARAVFGGFVVFPAGAEKAKQLYPPSYWPELRIVVALASKGPKKISSRKAMEISRLSSPFFSQWVSSSRPLVRQALNAIKAKDIEKLGNAVRLSYLRMHGVMLAGDPPVRYWLPRSMEVLDVCEELRNKGIGAWETMDAGPQVKILCTVPDMIKVTEAVKEAVPDIDIISAYPGNDPKTEEGEAEK